MNDKAEEVRAAVRDHYASLAIGAASGPAASPESSGCCVPSCCGGSTSSSLKMGYSPDDITSVPEGADLGLGCGNPQAFASLKAGEIVLDLGSGAGLDAFLAARQVAPSGCVIGVDMTPAMLERARSNAAQAGVKNVEFRLGEIEHLPVADASVDVILSNCVINLAPDKSAVFADAFRVLKPGGRIAISDVVAIKPLPDAFARSIAAHAGCIAGAADMATLEALLADSGFSDIRIKINAQSREFVRDWLPGSRAESYVASATIQATKRP